MEATFIWLEADINGGKLFDMKSKKITNAKAEGPVRAPANRAEPEDGFIVARLAERSQIGGGGRRDVRAMAFEDSQASCEEHQVLSPGLLVPDPGPGERARNTFLPPASWPGMQCAALSQVKAKGEDTDG